MMDIHRHQRVEPRRHDRGPQGFTQPWTRRVVMKRNEEQDVDIPETAYTVTAAINISLMALAVGIASKSGTS